MKVRVLSFGPLREARGAAEETVEVASGTTLAGLFAVLYPRHGALPVSYVRNLEHTTGDDVAEDGDEVAFLPPVGGG
ncbi:MAG TPA: MoaD/ThiS family protein [Myxococcota bacterium]|nr:MoaD/ThiS family protein [Myxococcota bacterium]